MGDFTTELGVETEDLIHEREVDDGLVGRKWRLKLGLGFCRVLSEKVKGEEIGRFLAVDSIFRFFL